MKYSSEMLVTRPQRGLFAKGIDLSIFAGRLRATGTNGVLANSSGVTWRIGEATPTWHLKFSASAEVRRITQYSIAFDYLEGRIAASGNQRHILPLRHSLPYGLTSRVLLSSIAEFPLAWVAQHRKSLIEAHYNRPDDFFLKFLDHHHRLYTQCHFTSADDDLEAASHRKIQRIATEFKRIDAERILDVGCGWGGVTTYLAHQFDVTALTLGRRSYEYTEQCLKDAGLSARVLLCDVLRHEADVPYDGIVILGVLEHVPQYGRLFARLARLTHPGSRIYIDCSSTYSRLAINPFIRQKIWPGTHGFVDLSSMLLQAKRNGFRVIELVDETADYAQTMGIWADRFVAERDEIVAMVGPEDYRAFEMYLYGGEESLLNGRLEGYRCIVEKYEG